MCTRSSDLHVLYGNDDNDDGDNDDNHDDDDEVDNNHKEHDHDAALCDNNPGQGTQLPVLTASFWRSRRLR